MNPPSIFISYNPNKDLEETLAIRLHTIGAVNGFNMYLPDRYGSQFIISNETKSRIRLSDYFILFSTGELSQIVKDEIKIAYDKLHDPSKIIVIYDIYTGRNLENNQFTEVYINSLTESQETIVNKILEKVIGKHKLLEKNEKENAIGGLMLTGIGLLLLAAFVSSDGKGK